MELWKILIAEDDKIARMFYDRSLSNEKFEKRFACNGEEVLEIYRSWAPHVLVLDIMMPIENGFSVLKTIRRDLNDQKTLIIMATSLSQAEDIKACFQFGVQGYLVKPINFLQVEAKILSCMDADVRLK
ncbi:MAG: response regulator [Syntrophobacteraceae bacterium]